MIDETPQITEEQVAEANAEMTRLFLAAADATAKLGEYCVTLGTKYPSIKVNKEMVRMLIDGMIEIGKVLDAV